jgi:hypothetical protein
VNSDVLISPNGSINTDGIAILAENFLLGLFPPDIDFYACASGVFSIVVVANDGPQHGFLESA